MVQPTPAHLTKITVLLRVAERGARPDCDVLLRAFRKIEGGKDGREAVGGGCLLYRRVELGRVGRRVEEGGRQGRWEGMVREGL